MSDSSFPLFTAPHRNFSETIISPSLNGMHSLAICQVKFAMSLLQYLSGQTDSRLSLIFLSYSQWAMAKSKSGQSFLPHLFFSRLFSSSSIIQKESKTGFQLTISFHVSVIVQWLYDQIKNITLFQLIVFKLAENITATQYFY